MHTHTHIYLLETNTFEIKDMTFSHKDALWSHISPLSPPHPKPAHAFLVA